jgi:hypothetical protein
VLAALAVAQIAAWELGPYQFLTSSPPSGPLELQISSGSLQSYRFVGLVGGVAFSGVAELAPPLAGASLRLAYDASEPDGRRLVLEIAGKLYPQTVPDWLLIPIARFADSEHHGCVSLFGPQTTEAEYDLIYHRALQNTLLGLRLLHADLLLFDLNNTWRLPKFGGHTVLGDGETEQPAADRASTTKLSSALNQARFQSWVLTDVGERVTVDMHEGALRFTGLPYYYFWISDFESYRREFTRLSDQAMELRRLGKIREHNQLVERINALEPRVTEVAQLTTALKDLREAIRDFNPPVYHAAASTMHYAAFFRAVKKQDAAAWREFLASLPATTAPPVVTPTRWLKRR